MGVSNVIDFNFKEQHVYLSQINSFSDLKKEKYNYDDIEIQTYSVIQTDKELPKDFTKEEELEKFLKNSEQKFIVNYFINDILDVSFYYKGEKLVNAVENKDFSYKFRDNNYPRRNECSAEGMRQCANQKVYSGGLASKIACGFAFYNCYGIHLADCFIANCTKLEEKFEELRLIDVKYEDKYLTQKLPVFVEYSIIEINKPLKVEKFLGGYKLN